MSTILDEIYGWYKENKRELPWRSTSNPYKIWISEIILQQTRVAQGIHYFNRFIEKFPTVNQLAFATEDEVLKLWQGLGYYSRARNLHFTAKIIINEYKSEFPIEYNEILKLKGIGPYTAAAISSIAFNLPHPAIDGNVYRVLSRYFGVETAIDSTKGKKEFQKIAEDLMPPNNPGMHNQALMEFGALQCIPKSPKCNLCPVIETCYAGKNNRVAKLPLKTKKVKQSKRYFYFYYFECEDYTFIEKRTQNDIWKNLYQFPLIESKTELSEVDIINSNLPINSGSTINIKSISAKKKHVLSHQIIYSRIIHIEIIDSNFRYDKFLRINKKDIFKFAVPRLLEQFIEDLNIE